MLFNNILSLKYKVEFKLITCLVVLSFILSMSGCATTETLRVESESIPSNKNYEIVNVITKDGKLIDLKGKSPRYVEELDNKKNVIMYTIDTVWITEKSYKTTYETKVIELDEVRWVTLESFEKNVEVTVTTKSGIRHKGELLSVANNKVSLINKRVKNNITVIEKDSIKKVFIHGEYNVLSGLGYGALIGAGIGVISGFAFGDGDKTKGFNPISLTAGQWALVLAAGYGLIGGLVGLILGIRSSTPEEVIEIKSDDDYYKLMKYMY